MLGHWLVFGLKLLTGRFAEEIIERFREEGFAVKKHSENGQVKILSNDKLFDLLKAANLEVPDTMDTEAGADMEQTNETVHLKIVNLPSFYRIIISTPSIAKSILSSGICPSAQSGREII